MPSHLSPAARDLIHSMLAVDPVKRISVPEIIEHPFFKADLPRYLTPLPPPPGPLLGTLSSLVSPPKPVDFEFIEGLGRIEVGVIEELASRMQGVTKDDIWDCLRRDDGAQGNAVKVAYMLLRDKHRQGRDCTFSLISYVSSHSLAPPVALYAEQEREAQLAALDVRTSTFGYVKNGLINNVPSLATLCPHPLFPPVVVIWMTTHSNRSLPMITKMRRLTQWTYHRIRNHQIQILPSSIRHYILKAINSHSNMHL